MSSHQKLTQSRLKELLHYDPETGVFRWRNPLSRRVKAGEVAGCIYSHGYMVIGCLKSQFFAHRLAWLYMHGTWPADEIDHIDGNKTNNALANLREATGSQNCANRRSAHLNKVGLKGVYKTSVNRYMARIRVFRKDLYLGTFDTAEEAHAAYYEAAKQLYGDFARAS